MKETLLITGGSGFLGRYIVQEFLDNSDVNIIGLYNSTEPDLDHPRLTWKHCNLLDYLSTEDVVKLADYVIHAAAIVSFDPNQQSEMLEFNVTSTTHIVNACLTSEVKKLIHVSSISALGAEKHGEITEIIKDNPPEYFSPYGLSKYKSELEVWRGVAEGLQACIINPSLIIGAGDWSKGSPNMITTVAEGMKYHPTGSTGFVYAKDVARMINILLWNQDVSERFLCSCANMSYQSVMNLVAEELGVSKPTQPITDFHIKAIAIWNWIRKPFRRKSTAIITKDSLITANTPLTYSNQKTLDRLQFQYTPIDMSIREICKEYPLTSS